MKGQLACTTIMNGYLKRLFIKKFIPMNRKEHSNNSSKKQISEETIAIEWFNSIFSIQM